MEKTLTESSQTGNIEEVRTALSLAADYAGADAFAREAIRKYDFGEREIAILDLIRHLSYEQRRPRAIIPKQRHIAEITGLAETHVSTLIQVLSKIKRVVSVTNEYHYMFTTNPDQWHEVQLRYQASPRRESLLGWLRGPAPDPKGEPLPLDELGPLVQEAAAAAITVLPTRGTGGHSGAVHPNLKGGASYRESALVGSRPVEQASRPGEVAPPRPASGAGPPNQKVTESVRVTESVSLRDKVTESVRVTESVTFPPTPPCLNVSTVSVLPKEALKSIETVEAFNQGGTGGKLTKSITPGYAPGEDEFLQRYRQVCPDRRDEGWGGFWRNRYREDRELCECALERTILRKDNPKPFKKTAGAWMRDQFQRLIVREGRGK